MLAHVASEIATAEMSDEMLVLAADPRPEVRASAARALAAAPLALAIWAASLLLGLGPGSGVLPLVLRLAVMGGLIGASLWLFCLNGEDRALLLRLALRRVSVAAATQ